MVITKIADMSKRVLTEKQKALNKLMKHANIVAKKIIADPQLKEEACQTLNVAPNKVYRAYIKEFMKRKGEDYILPSISAARAAASGNPRDHIEMNPSVMNGKPVIKNTNVTVEEILDRLSKGASIPEVLAGCPGLRMQDVLASLAFASKLASI